MAVEGERDLRELARRWAEAERRVRALVAKAPEGSRRLLIVEAIGILTALRQLDAEGAVTTAYLRAFRAIREGGDSGRVRDLARALAGKLDRAAQTAQGGSRAAIGRVTVDTIEDAQLEAVTGYPMIAIDAGRSATMRR